MSNGPSRGGVRGGRDQFDWINVVNDRKHRDNYLGHSLHSSNKRSFNNPNPNALWWAKSDNKKSTQADILKMKAEEDRLMLEELGIIPKSEEVSSMGLEKDEFDRITERGFSRDQNDVDRVAGLGFGDERRHKRALLAVLPKKNGHENEKNELELTDNAKHYQNSDISTPQNIESNSNIKSDKKDKKREKKRQKQKKRKEKERKETF